MASKCGRSVTAWNALVTTLAKQGDNMKALSCLEDMQQLHVSPNASTLSCLLKVCGSVRSIDRGREIHAETVGKGLLDMDPVLCSALIHMYSECGSFAEAREVFAKLRLRDTGSWNASIASRVKEGDDLGAMSCFDRMILEGASSPDAITFTSGLKACSGAGDGAKGRELHGEVTKRGVLAGGDPVLASALVDMYAKCGSIAESRQVFGAVSPPRSVGVWNSVIAADVRHGRHEEASESLKQMKQEGTMPDTITYASCLKACSNIGALRGGRELHCIVESAAPLPGKDSAIVHGALVDMYARNGRLREAREAFGRLPVRGGPGSWTALISGYVERDLDDEALACWEQMRARGVAPDAVAYTCILRACGKAGALEKGAEIRGEADRSGLAEDPGVRSALVGMYTRCGCFAAARDCVDGLGSRDALVWTSVLAGYAENGRRADALACFEQMQAEGVLPDRVTFSRALRACGGGGGGRSKGREMHARVAAAGFLREELPDSADAARALLAMYARLGDAGSAVEALDRLRNPGTDAWNAVIAEYSGDLGAENALRVFARMQETGASPDVVTYACVLSACARAGAASGGRSIHADLEKRGLLLPSGGDSAVANALLDMYAKCGCLAEASRAFAMMLEGDWDRRGAAVFGWDILLSGFAQKGKLRGTLRVFERMMNNASRPSAVSLLAVLNACSHAGALRFGLECFDSMVHTFGVVPTAEHCTCAIDLLGRSGQLDRAWAMADRQLPFQPDAAVWSAVLSSCRGFSDSELGSNAFLRIVELDCREGRAAYSCLRSIYAAAR